MSTSNLKNNLEPYLQRISERSTVKKSPKSQLAIHRFREAVKRFDDSYENILKAGKAIIISSEENEKIQTIVSGKSHHERQHDFLSATQSFNDSGYALMSATIMLLNHILPKDMKRDMPLRSCKKFLLWLLERAKELNQEILSIEYSRAYRAKFVAHVQQTITSTWMTYCYPYKEQMLSVIIHYIPDPNAKAPKYKGVDNPFIDGFCIPIANAGYYVAPQHESVNEAFNNLLPHLIECAIQKAWNIDTKGEDRSIS